MALVVVNTVSSDPIVPEKEYLSEGRVKTTLTTGVARSGKEVYITFPWSVEVLNQEVVMTSLEAFRNPKGFWNVGYLRPQNRGSEKFVDLLLFLQRDNVKLSFSRREGKGLACMWCQACGLDTMCLGVRLEPDTTLKVVSLTGGRDFYFSVSRDEEGKFIFSRPSAEEAEQDGTGWCQNLPIFRWAKR